MTKRLAKKILKSYYLTYGVPRHNMFQIKAACDKLPHVAMEFYSYRNFIDLANGTVYID